MTRPMLTLLTDFGPDSAAAICRGVILGIAPDAQIVDISHSVAKYQIRDGAFLLWCALPWMPVGVHVAVVDPGVGTARRPIGIRTGRGDVLIGPDNGLIVPAAERLGGIVEARELANRDLWLADLSTTFHGRDIFSPTGAHVAIGTPFDQVGPVISRDELVWLEIADAHSRDGGLDSSVVYIDSFGNARLAGDPADLTAAVGTIESGRLFSIELGADQGVAEERLVAPWARTFGEVEQGRPLLYEDSFGRLALADNQGSIATRVGLRRDRPIRIVPA